MNDAICVRDITREPLDMVTCISGSKCVTRLIKILCDLLHRTERGRKRWRKRLAVRERERERKGVGGRRVTLQDNDEKENERKSMERGRTSCEKGEREKEGGREREIERSVAIEMRV